MTTEKLQSLYELARQARDNNDRVSAETYYESIQTADPNSWEAGFYLAFYKFKNSSVACLEDNSQEYAMGLGHIFDLAKASCQDSTSFKEVALEIKSRTEQLAKQTVDYAKSDYPALATSQEYTARVFAGFTPLLVLADGLELYFPDGELAAESADLRKEVINYYAQLAKSLGNWNQIVASGDFDRGFGSTVNKIKAFDSSYSIPSHSTSSQNTYSPSSSSSSSSSGGCYIATAVYGSYDCPEVWTLRRFRDNKLASTWYGRAFVRFYYATSPTLVKWFGSSVWFRNLCKVPLDNLVSHLLAEGVDNTPYHDVDWQ